MRIFYAAGDTPNSFVPWSRLWYDNLFRPLGDLGHELVPFAYDLNPHYLHADKTHIEHRAFIERERPVLEKALLEQVETAHQERPLDLFFSYFYDALCRPQVIETIRSWGIPAVNWYCNGSYQLHLVEEIAPAYTWCLVPEALRMDDYRRLGANPVYFQEAANPYLYRPFPELVQEFDVTFVGQRYGDRPEFATYLIENGVDLRLWGWGWKEAPKEPAGPEKPRWAWWLQRLAEPSGYGALARKQTGRLKKLVPGGNPEPPKTIIPPENVGSYLSDEEMVRLYSRSRISLGFSSCGDTHRTGERILQIRLRDFEAPMSGAFYLVEEMEELKQFFREGEEMVFYRDKRDLLDKIRYYLAHPEEREAIRKAGYRRALRDHSWQKRFHDFFTSVGLPGGKVVLPEEV